MARIMSDRLGHGQSVSRGGKASSPRSHGGERGQSLRVRMAASV